MKKWQKCVLVVSSLFYLIGLTFLIWPSILDKLYRLLDKINLNVKHFDTQSIIYYYALSLLILTLVIILIILFFPTQRPDVLLVNSKNGRLALSNDGVTSFVKTQLSGEGLSNIKVTFKNTKRGKKFLIVADTAYKKHKINELPRIERVLIDKLTTLLSGVDDTSIKINIQINQLPGSKNKVSRVV